MNQQDCFADNRWGGGGGEIRYGSASEYYK